MISYLTYDLLLIDMRITIRQLRQIIREALQSPRTVFNRKLHELARDNRWFIPLSHESPIENLDSIRENGLEGEPFSTLGFLKHKSFVTGHGIIVHFRVPISHVTKHTIVPDMRYGTMDEGDIAYEEFLVEHPEMIGGEVCVNITVPKKWIVDIIDNETKKSVLKEALGFYLSDYQAGPNGQHPNDTENPGGNRRKLGLDTSSELDDSYIDATSDDNPIRGEVMTAESVVPDDAGHHTPDDMNRILSYGLELGDDDGTGESGGTEDINKGKTHESVGWSTAHKPGNVKPTKMLGTSYLDDVDGVPLADLENTDEDFPVRSSSTRQGIPEGHLKMREIFEPGYQEFSRTMSYGTEDVDGPTKMSNEDAAWSTCQELYDTVKDIWGIKSMSNPSFIDYALEELRKDGTPDGICSRMRFKLENENAVDDF